jgi:hypothetical protein
MTDKPLIWRNAPPTGMTHFMKGQALVENDH